MGIMVMIVIGGDEGMMVVVAMMFLMWLYPNSWHWKRSSSLNYVWPPYFLHISPFSWLPLAHPCLFVCMNNIFPPIFSPSSLSFPSLMCHTFSPKRLPLLPNWSLCFTVWLLLPSTTLNPFSTWQSEWSWESINHILLLPVYLQYYLFSGQIYHIVSLRGKVCKDSTNLIQPQLMSLQQYKCT